MYKKGCSMLNQVNQILDKMEQDDPNVQALRTLINSTEIGEKVYFLRYKGKLLTCTRIYDHGCLGDCFLGEDYDEVWSTKDLITAIYVKNVSTPSYNSCLDTPCHNRNLVSKKIEVIDNYDNVYNRKLLTNRTMAIIKAKIYKDNGYLRHLKDKKWANSPINSLYEQKYMLEDAKREYNLITKGKLRPLKDYSLSELIHVRKALVKSKGDKIKEGKSYITIQKALDRVNKKIKVLGGK